MKNYSIHVLFFLFLVMVFDSAAMNPVAMKKAIKASLIKIVAELIDEDHDGPSYDRSLLDELLTKQTKNKKVNIRHIKKKK